LPAAWLISTTRRPSWSARFAFDDAIAVAERVLMHSQQLSDADLVENATQDHLLAIAQHLKIDERVTDVLNERGDCRVMHKLATKQGRALLAQTDPSRPRQPQTDAGACLSHGADPYRRDEGEDMIFVLARVAWTPVHGNELSGEASPASNAAWNTGDVARAHQ